MTTSPSSPTSCRRRRRRCWPHRTVPLLQPACPAASTTPRRSRLGSGVRPNSPPGTSPATGRTSTSRRSVPSTTTRTSWRSTQRTARATRCTAAPTRSGWPHSARVAMLPASDSSCSTPMPCPPLVTPQLTGGLEMSEKPVRRSRSRHAGSITSYATHGGHRWRFQIYVPKDPERPELGDTRLTRGGVKSLDEAQRVLAEALAKKKSNARFQAKAPTIGEYAERWIAGLRLQNSTIQGYQKIIRNHVTPYLGAIQLDKLTATRIAAHYRQLETSGRRDRPGY